METLRIAVAVYWDWFTLLLLIPIAWKWPKLGNSAILRVEAFCTRIARMKGAALLILITTVIVLRVVLIPFFPIRPAGIQDEYSYLLAGDTFAHGRLANPPHPMALYLDTFNELFAPTYASMYEPGQGAFLAIGEKLGHPWIGVLASMALLFGALLWMLQGWVSPEWALFGALLPLFRFGIFSYWMNTYWGGAVAALGGCLVLGSYARLIHKLRVRESVILGFGAALVANSRPYEGFLTLLPVAIAGALWLARPPRRPLLFRRVILPLLIVALLTGSFMLYYNYRVTRNPVLFPHRLYEQRFMSMSIFVWPEQGPLKQYSNPQFEVMFNRYSRNQYRRSWSEFQRISWTKLKDFVWFYFGPAAFVPFVALPWVLLDRRMKLVVWQLIFAAFASLGAIWFSPHYAAPALASTIIILVQSFRHLRKWIYKGRPIGIGLTRAFVALVLATFLVHGYQTLKNPSAPLPLGWGWWGIWDRENVKTELESIPGKHLVILRYTPGHHYIHREWVYNDADIDESRIVWAREIPGADMEPLFRYYSDRKVWVVEPDEDARIVRPYSPPTETDPPRR